MDGAALLEQIRADERFNKTRTIPASTDTAQAGVLRDKVNIVLIKPILFTRLRDTSARLKTGSL